MTEGLKRLVPQIKDLSEQRPGPLVIIAANGVATPIYADAYTVEDGVFIAWRVNGPNGTVNADDDGIPVYACGVADARFYGADVVELKTVEDIQRESLANTQAQHKLIKDITEPLAQDIKRDLGLTDHVHDAVQAAPREPGQYL